MDKSEVNRLARVMMTAWEKAEGKPVNVSYVATFVDMARAVVSDKNMTTPPCICDPNNDYDYCLGCVYRRTHPT